jgi:hypothetical protein
MVLGAEMENGMTRLTLGCCILSLLAAPALAADTKVDAAVTAFEQVGADAAKLKAYCAMSKLMNETGDDENKAQAAEPQVDAYMKELGPELEAALNAGEPLDEKSPDYQKYDEAISKLEEKCPE